MKRISLEASTDFSVLIIETLTEAGWKLDELSPSHVPCFVHIEFTKPNKGGRK